MQGCAWLGVAWAHGFGLLAVACPSSSSCRGRPEQRSDRRVTHCPWSRPGGEAGCAGALCSSFQERRPPPPWSSWSRRGLPLGRAPQPVSTTGARRVLRWCSSGWPSSTCIVQVPGKVHGRSSLWSESEDGRSLWAECEDRGYLGDQSSTRSTWMSRSYRLAPGGGATQRTGGENPSISSTRPAPWGSFQ